MALSWINIRFVTVSSKPRVQSVGDVAQEKPSALLPVVFDEDLLFARGRCTVDFVAANVDPVDGAQDF